LIYLFVILIVFININKSYITIILYIIMKKIQLYLLTITIALLMSNCTSENLQTESPSPIFELTLLKEKFPAEFNNLNLGSFKEIDKLLLTRNSEVIFDLSVQSYDIENPNGVYGYFLNSSSFTVLALVDVLNEKITIFDLINNSKTEFLREKDDKRNIQLFDKTHNRLISAEESGAAGASNSCDAGLMLCGVGCTLATIAIMATDGPLPIMDVVAAAYYVTCNAGCIVSYDNCIEI